MVDFGLPVSRDMITISGPRQGWLNMGLQAAMVEFGSGLLLCSMGMSAWSLRRYSLGECIGIPAHCGEFEIDYPNLFTLPYFSFDTDIHLTFSTECIM